MSSIDQAFFRKRVVAGVEHRRDPLFGSWTRINPDRSKRVKHTGETSRGKDLQNLIEDYSDYDKFPSSQAPAVEQNLIAFIEFKLRMQ